MYSTFAQILACKRDFKNDIKKFHMAGNRLFLKCGSRMLSSAPHAAELNADHPEFIYSGKTYSCSKP